MRIKITPKQKQLQSLLCYEPLTGEFVWRVRHEKAFNMSGKHAGTKSRKSIVLSINNKTYAAHRLAWVYVHGDVLTQDMQVDHINNNPHDNRIVNLRIATHAQNCSNARKWTKKSLPKGVSLQPKSGRYRVRIQVEKRGVYLGTYDTPEEAHEVYCEAAKKYHGEFARAS